MSAQLRQGPRRGLRDVGEGSSRKIIGWLTPPGREASAAADSPPSPGFCKEMRRPRRSADASLEGPKPDEAAAMAPYLVNSTATKRGEPSRETISNTAARSCLRDSSIRSIASSGVETGSC